MYGSPTYITFDINASKVSDFTSRRIKEFYIQMVDYLHSFYSTPTCLHNTFQEMRLPKSNIINVGIGCYAQSMLFLAAIEDLTRNGMVDKGLTPKDIEVANEFRSSLRRKIEDYWNGKYIDRLRYIERDILPLLGKTLKTTVLVPTE